MSHKAKLNDQTTVTATVTGRVFGNLCGEKNTVIICGQVSVILSVPLTICHISACKTASVTRKDL